MEIRCVIYVFVVSLIDPFEEGWWVEKVFDSKWKAEKYIEENTDPEWTHKHYVINVMEIE